MNQVDCVVFILYKNGKILVEKRKEIKMLDPSKVTIPGGHVHEGETFEEACKRELKEELNIKCNKFRFIIKLFYHTNTEDQILYYYLCEDWKGEPECNEAEKIFWIGPDQLNLLDLEVDRKAANKFFKMCTKIK